MNYKDLISIIKPMSAFLEADGFVNEKTRASDQCILYYKKTDITTIQCVFAWAIYGETFDLRYPDFKIRFHELEEFVKQYYDQVNDSYYSIGHLYSKKDIPNYFISHYLEREGIEEITTIQQLSEYMVNVQSYYPIVKTQFIDKYQNLSDVFETYKDLSRDKIQYFLDGSGNTLAYKEMVLTYMFNPGKIDMLLCSIEEEFKDYMEIPYIQDIINRVKYIKEDLQKKLK
jgi:virulence-associated protein VapD